MAVVPEADAYLQHALGGLLPEVLEWRPYSLPGSACLCAGCGGQSDIRVQSLHSWMSLQCGMEIPPCCRLAEEKMGQRAGLFTVERLICLKSIQVSTPCAASPTILTILQAGASHRPSNL